MRARVALCCVVADPLIGTSSGRGGPHSARRAGEREEAPRAPTTNFVSACRALGPFVLLTHACVKDLTADRVIHLDGHRHRDRRGGREQRQQQQARHCCCCSSVDLRVFFFSFLLKTGTWGAWKQIGEEKCPIRRARATSARLSPKTNPGLMRVSRVGGRDVLSFRRGGGTGPVQRAFNMLLLFAGSSAAAFRVDGGGGNKSMRLSLSTIDHTTNFPPSFVPQQRHTAIARSPPSPLSSAVRKKLHETDEKRFSSIIRAPFSLNSPAPTNLRCS